MTSLSTRIASIALAFGFFISCTSGTLTIEEQLAGSSPEELLTSAEERLESQPDDPAANHMAGYAHFRLAGETPVSARHTHYRSMSQRFDRALAGYTTGQNRGAIQHIKESISQAWSAEFLAGKRLKEYPTPDSARLDTLHWRARNSIEIGPDSLNAHVFLSDVYLLKNNYLNAADALFALERFEISEAGPYFERLAYLLSRNGEFGQASRWYMSAIDWMETYQGESLMPSGNPTGTGTLLNTYHGTINSLLESGQTENAIFYLERLAETIQDNAPYNELLILQYFNQVRASELDEFGGITLDNLRFYFEKIDAITQEYPHFATLTSAELIDLLSIHVDLRREFDEAYEPAADEVAVYISAQALDILNSLYDNDSENEDIVYALATVYSLMEDDENADYWNSMLD